MGQRLEHRIAIRHIRHPGNRRFEIIRRAHAITAFPVSIQAAISGSSAGDGYDYSGNDGNLNDLWKFGSIIPEGVQLRVFCEANEIISDQNAPVVLGTAPVSIAGPSKTFTIRNNGSETLVFGVPFAEPNHFIITQPEVNVLAPGDYTTFTVTLDTTEIGVFQETISFDNNDVDI